MADRTLAIIRKILNWHEAKMSSAKKSASRENAVGEYAHALAHHLATTLPEGEDRGGYWDAALDLWPYLPEEQTLWAIQRAADVCAYRARILQEEADNLRRMLQEDDRLRQWPTPKTAAPLELCNHILNDQGEEGETWSLRERGLTKAEIAWASDRAEDIDERRLARRILGVLQGNMKMETAALLARFLAAHGQSERESFADYIRAARKYYCSPLTDAEVEWVVEHEADIERARYDR
jgi:hypothetical protein